MDKARAVPLRPTRGARCRACRLESRAARRASPSQSPEATATYVPRLWTPSTRTSRRRLPSNTRAPTGACGIPEASHLRSRALRRSGRAATSRRRKTAWKSCPLSFVDREIAPQRREDTLRVLHFTHAFGGDLKVLFRATATLGRRIAERGGHIPLPLEAVERRVDAADRHVTAAIVDFMRDRHAIGVVTHAEQREQNHEFELADLFFSHFVFRIIANSASPVAPLHPRGRSL